MGYAMKTISLILLSMIVLEVQAQFYTFNVKRLGAIPDGISDSTDTLLNAWEMACHGNMEGQRAIFIPPGVYLVRPLVFVGPCKGPVNVHISGILKAPEGILGGADSWIAFQNVDGMKIYGQGSLDGQGASAWSHNNCKGNPFCKTLPVSLKLISVLNVKIKGLTFLNSKFFHINIYESSNILLKNINIVAPADSINTDGIHLGNSNNVRIYNSIISTGDDCISLGPGSTDVIISDVKCGPGHGISIGSLGKYAREENVRNITVQRCELTGTTNGVRIKTWAESPPSAASDMLFKDIVMNDVLNPIFINQDYCPNGNCNRKGNSRVQISNLIFDNIRGTSSSDVAVNLQCSHSSPCYDIRLHNIDLRNADSGGEPIASCSNVIGTASGKQSPIPCI
ncbi:exopolygalacturonase-like [Impatiens glandulifera]|uniref:exopolygalacturonase-like n=1 Tax=Impatiens glandulifera TaxID=253017 RepID=UPI001FB18C36|nr:exopolygalacturonase-like [Impatiens glandulifera]